MPTYEYKCPAGHVFDKFYPAMNSNRRLKCPTCGKMAERQISGGAGLVFKGSGFYATDYKRAADTRKEPEGDAKAARSEEHTSELQSPCNLVCRLLLEKKKKASPP